MSGLIQTQSEVITATPTISTSIYASGDQLGGVMTITKAIRAGSATSLLQAITICEKGTQKAAMDIVFFHTDPTSVITSVDNGVFAITAANVAAYVLGYTTISTSDWITVGSGAVASVRNIGGLHKPVSGQDIYAAVIVRGTPTYASTSDLTFRFKYLQD